MSWVFLFGTTLSVSTLAVVFLMGTSRRVTGYWLGLFTQVAWCTYVLLAVYQPALLVLQAPLILVYGRHLLVARHVPPAPIPAEPPPAAAAPVPLPRTLPAQVIGKHPLAGIRDKVLAPWTWVDDGD